MAPVYEVFKYLLHQQNLKAGFYEVVEVTTSGDVSEPQNLKNLVTSSDEVNLK